MRYIGDIHGDFDGYFSLISECSESIQVGDFGAGFVEIPNIPDGHRWIRGNHDNPELCKQSPNWIKDCTFDGKHFFLGGAMSVDQKRRKIGIDWWPEEELSFEELYDAVDLYAKIKPEIMVTHDMPSNVCEALRIVSSKSTSRTAQALSAMFDSHRPKLWIFGHFHRRIEVSLRGTEFVGLGILDYIDR